MRAIARVALLAVVAGVALIAFALATGQAMVALVVVIPVVYGHSPVLASGIGLVVLGLVVAMLAASTSTEERDPAGAAKGDGSGGYRTGGVLLIGPVPIVWGAGASLSRRARWALAALGGGSLAVAVAVLVLTVR